MRRSLAMLAAGVLVLSGCGSDYDKPLSPSGRKVNPGAFGVSMDSLEGSSAPAGQKKAEQPDNEAPKPENAKPEKKAGGQAQETAAAKKPAAPAGEMVREKAKVGAGEKGRGYGGDILTTPVSVYWRAQERIIYDRVKHALDLYKAMSGHAPKTHEEFMEKVIKANQLKLPELPRGYKYVYDTKKEELMVEHPKR